MGTKHSDYRCRDTLGTKHNDVLHVGYKTVVIGIVKHVTYCSFRILTCDWTVIGIQTTAIAYSRSNGVGSAYRVSTVSPVTRVGSNGRTVWVT